MKKLLVIFALSSALLSHQLCFAENIEFLGGSGAPFSLTITKPIKITLNETTSNADRIWLVFMDIYTFSASQHASLADGLTISGPNFTDIDIALLAVVVPAGNFGTNGKEIGIRFDLPTGTSLATGSILMINPGTATTINSLASSIPNPVNLSYTYILADESILRLDATIQAVPESKYFGVYSIIFILLISGFHRIRRYKVEQDAAANP